MVNRRTRPAPASFADYRFPPDVIRLRTMRGLRTDRTASTVIRSHVFVQNLRRGHYELGVEAPYAGR